MRSTLIIEKQQKIGLILSKKKKNIQKKDSVEGKITKRNRKLDIT